MVGTFNQLKLSSTITQEAEPISVRRLRCRNHGDVAELAGVLHTCQTALFALQRRRPSHFSGAVVDCFAFLKFVLKLITVLMVSSVSVFIYSQWFKAASSVDSPAESGSAVALLLVPFLEVLISIIY